MLIQTLQLALVAWLPGAVVFRLPLARRERRAALEPSERLFWAVVISLGVSLSAVLILAAARLYTFERLLLADMFVAVGAAALGRFQLRLRSPRWITSASLLPLVLVALGIWRFFPPSEYVIGGRDPGVYMNEGIQIAQRGALVMEDPVVAAVPPAARNLFFPSHQRPDYYSLRFMGFWIKNPDTGAVVGQFPHLFPASIAIGYGIDGLTGARRVVGVWAILGLLAVYFAAARLIGPAAAGAAAVLLALNVIQVWFARYPNAEVVMQALLFAAILASARAHFDNDPFFAPVAALLLGLLLFLRFDAVLGVAGVVLGLLAGRLAGGRLQRSFPIILACCFVAMAVYLLGPMRAYAHRPILFLTNLRAWQYVVIGAAVALMGVGTALAVRRPALSTRISAVVPRTLSVGLVIAAVYALYLREPADKLADFDAYALRIFTGYYLTLPALIAALVGYVLWSRRGFWRAPELFATVALFSFFFFYKIRIVPDHFWMARRFLPVILPGALVFASAAALGTRGGPLVARVAGRIVGLTFVALLALHYARASRPIMNHVEYAGVIPRLERLASAISPADLLVVESRNAGTDLHTLALPLAYIYDRRVLVLDSPLPDKAVFAAFLEWARTRHPRVLFMGGGGTDLLSPNWGVRVVAEDRFRVPEYDDPGYEYPRHANQKQFDYTLFEFTPPAGSPSADIFDIDIGHHDDLNVLRFYAKEQTEGRVVRWSGDVSYVVLPTMFSHSRTVTLWMSDGGRPAAADPADVQVSLADEYLGAVRVTTGFKPYTLSVPPGLAARLAAVGAPVRLRIETSTWVPERLLGTPDDRALGVMVDRVAIK